jgi:hypothetical protein
MKVSNPYTLEVTLDKLRVYLNRTAHSSAIELLEMSVNKAKQDRLYYFKFEQTLLFGSTNECRDLFSDFGEYFEASRSDFPFYPHKDAVNVIDYALYHVKLGIEAPITDFNCCNNGELPDLSESASLEISAVFVATLDDDSTDSRALFGVASGAVNHEDLIDKNEVGELVYTVYHRHQEGWAEALHDADTLTSAQIVASQIAAKYPLQIVLN